MRNSKTLSTTPIKNAAKRSTPLTRKVGRNRVTSGVVLKSEPQPPIDATIPPATPSTQKTASFWKRVVPLWLAVTLIIQSSLITGIVEYAYMKNQLTKTLTKLVKQQQNPEEFIKSVEQTVLPASGYETRVMWGDLVKRLVEVGAIDPEKYKQTFNSKTNGMDELDLMGGGASRPIKIHENNAHFVVNTLWALGLTQKSKILEEGPMKTSGQTANMVSTGGWTLGKKGAMDLYSSQELIKLTPEQQEQVKKIAENVYRPCCGNHSAFPDCNHGMAALGYIELAVAVGLTEEQIYKDLLAFNSFWFPQQYVDIGVYLAKNQGTEWKNVDAKLALSSQYSSSQGYQTVKQSIQNIPGTQRGGSGCGA